ncbi:MAG: cysteine desulfurase NifS, cysteine desulfurase [Candidatus Peregrinibacteria bacterium GW2011_GWE2_39_6]|nr:MAG: cysteine desulfurase NifS, cysteine desulfurase [Candidatus Peregrinibacteria bacterium GW2011_GWF2_39_17]KKR26653.1 MAG: cysteine desulfurase NifS, cysteine desulfurase [Candidatus Peregrinibacteria bacterium GW2011_GWE2_39_6]HCW32241.1 cysteine desulfurase NifS [Candidatus Peregrinibacteria bacterium]
MIYLDHAAATPLDVRVLNTILPYFHEKYGNPSSLHTFGQQSREAINQARQLIANFIECNPKEIIFTSSGTESNNLAIFGIAQAYEKHGHHLITTQIEHESVLEPYRHLEKQGWEVTYLPVDRDGIVKIAALEKALSPKTTLVSIMTANNEIGTIQPIKKFAAIIKKYKDKQKPRPDQETKLTPPFFHTDACQAAGTLGINHNSLGIDLLSFNGSKIYGPKGIGALYLKKGINLTSQQYGGSQEYKRRAGTENVPAIIGLAKALEIAQQSQTVENKRLIKLRDYCFKKIQINLKNIILNGHLTQRLPNNLNLTIKGIEGEILLMRLDQAGIFASAGSACTAGSTEPSHVLRAIGRSKQEAYGSIRFSLGHSNDEVQIKHFLKTFLQIVKEIRAESGR